MLSAKKVAEYFLAKTEPDYEEYISNLKLQKILYYAQGFYLAIHNKRLFADSIEAWTHGPVVETLYHEYKESGSKAIDPPESIDLSIYNKETTDLLDEVWQVYGQYSAYKLRNLTHEEPPWKDAFKRTPGNLISPDSMRKYFKTLLIDDQEETSQE